VWGDAPVVYPCRIHDRRNAKNVPGERVKEMSNYIDVHVHVWTPDTLHYPLAKGYKKEDMKPASFTPDELFKHTRPAGVNRVNLIQMSYYGFDND
jgi:predicted TIM-barrel fold metal-dependent hydrolase